MADINPTLSAIKLSTTKTSRGGQTYKKQTTKTRPNYMLCSGNTLD